MTTNQQLSYSIEGAVAATGLTRTAIYLAISEGSLRSWKLGRRRMISAKALEEFIAKLERDSTGRAAA